MVSVHGSLCGGGNSTVLNQSGGEVGCVGSDVSFLAVQLEVQVLVGTLQILTCQLDALDGDDQTDVVLEGLAGGELLGDVGGLNGLDGLINNTEGTALGLLHTVVGGGGSCDLNGHTKLNACHNGVSVKLVAVVTALAVQIGEEQVVTGVAKALGVDTDNDTPDGHVRAFCGIDVVLKRGQLVLGNLALVGNALGSAVDGDGSGQLIDDLLGGLLVDADSPHGATLNELDLLFVNVKRPGYGVNTDADDIDLTDDLVVSRGREDAFLLVEVVQDRDGGIQKLVCGGLVGLVITVVGGNGGRRAVIVRRGRGGAVVLGLGGGGAVVLGLSRGGGAVVRLSRGRGFYGFLFGSTRSEHSETHEQRQSKCK